MAQKKKSSDEPDYEELRSELESILSDLQGGDLDIDQALERYKRGLELVKQLEKYLATAENTVRELKRKFDAGGK